MHVEPGDPDSAEGAAPDGVKSLFFVNAEFGGQTGTAAEAEGRIDAQPYALSLCFLTDEADFARAVSVMTQRPMAEAISPRLFPGAE